VEKADAEVARLLPASVAATATRADKLALAAAQRVADAARAAAKAAVTEIAKAEKRVRANPAAATAAARAAATGLVHKPSQKELDEAEEEGGEGVPTLREVAEKEAALSPVDQKQLPQLLFRLANLRRCEAAGKPNAFSLCPQAGFQRKHVRMELPTLLRLLNGGNLSTAERVQPRRGSNTFDAAVRRLFTPWAVTHALKGAADWRFGSSLSTDGVSLHLSVVNGVAAAGKAAKAAGAAQGKARGRAARAACEEFINKPKHKSSLSAPKKRVSSHALKPAQPKKVAPVPAAQRVGKVYVAVDPGNTNVLGVAICRADQDPAVDRLETFTVSTRQYRTDTGEAGRRNAAKKRLAKRRLSDRAFVRAEAALLAHPTTVSDDAQAGWAQQERHAAFSALHSLYGSTVSCRALLKNYSGRKRVLARYANSLVRGKPEDTVVLLGDAEFSSTFGGKNGAAGPMVKAIQELRKKGVTVEMVDEYRSSQLDPQAAGRCVVCFCLHL
jgi:hypothetical protein